ncbi:MAG: 16S rRNA (cytidine(1402)-2'-O)-methyltransferase [Alphaproteobacteria bacterium]
MKPLASQIQPPGLYIVATPIGNLGDITLRALEVLKTADLIACEDTRVTAKLLSHYGIKKLTLSYNDHNAVERRPEIFNTIRNGGRVALISDAGTPLISDPGYKLVREAVTEGLYVTTLPGASSVLAALCLAALPTDRFLFAGFLPPKQEGCKKELAALDGVDATLVFFESAKRLQKTLSLMHSVLGNRSVAVARELTKLHEECRRGTLAELVAYYDKHGEPKGEVVIVVSPPLAEEKNIADVENKLRLLLKTHSVKEAASILAEETGMARKEIYSKALDIIKHESDE